MKKKLLFIFILVYALFFLTSCEARTYSFQAQIGQIESIEIISVESGSRYEVMKVLSESEKGRFLKQFQTIKFHDYFLGDPMSVSGDTIKITYRNGMYEMICYYWGEYVKNGKKYFVAKYCDEEVFNDLLNDFL